MPIYLYGETRTSRHIPNDILRELHGFIHMFEDTPEFVAPHHPRSQVYLDAGAAVLPALVDYARRRGSTRGTAPATRRRGVPKSPVGQMFHQFFGENMLRADVCNAVEELGQLLDHTGPVASERNAARIFNADHTSSPTARRQDRVAPTVAPHRGVDRNCHKSILHAIIMTGAIPVFLMPTRNHYGIIGPIPKSEFDLDDPQEDRGQSVRAQGAKNQKPRILTITQSTYDGVLYNVEPSRAAGRQSTPALRRSLAAARGLPRLLWRHARHRQDRPRARIADLLHPVHPQAAGRPLAGLADAGAGFETASWTARFNEAYLMHTSTSPQYSIIASATWPPP
jgi:arginine decarboxylase